MNTSVIIIIIILVSSSLLIGVFGAYFIMNNAEEEVEGEAKVKAAATQAAIDKAEKVKGEANLDIINEATPEPANVGEAISCYGYNPKGDGAIYRYDGHKSMRHYPNPDIAGSWDPDWMSGVNRRIDCTGFTLGNDIQMHW